MKTIDAEINLSWDVPMLTCESCHISFILLGGKKILDEHEFGEGKPVFDLWKQAGCYYCPYCGEKQR